MPMDQFKALLQKDDRVPQLTDKKKLISAISAKLTTNLQADFSNEKFQTKVFQQALTEAIREQERLNRGSRPQRNGVSPIKGSMGARPPLASSGIAARVDTQSSVLQTSINEAKRNACPWR